MAKDYRILQGRMSAEAQARAKEKAEEFMTVIREHHCSVLFRDPYPEDFKEYFHRIKDPRWLALVEVYYD